MDNLIRGFVDEMQEHKDNFFHPDVVPVRALLQRLRDCEKTFFNLSAHGNSKEDTESIKQEIEEIKEMIKEAVPSDLLKKFLVILDQSNAVTIVPELAYQIKLFVEQNTEAEL